MEMIIKKQRRSNTYKNIVNDRAKGNHLINVYLENVTKLDNSEAGTLSKKGQYQNERGPEVLRITHFISLK